MHFILNLILGALSGFIAGKIMDSHGGLLRNILLGIVGGIVGGTILGLFGMGATNWIGQVVVSIAGACIVIWVGRKIFH
jgi:uncharacterized membrane protein YeaQ/YmgE (transglycosylase-associated protein family)